jgi:pyruvate formate-lyase activating enzyme-like uncharacterized protein
MTPEAGAERQRSGVKVIRNTKGYSFEVHLYNDDTDMAATLKAMAEVVDELDSKYPRGDA